MVLATLLGHGRGLFRGFTDGAISRFLDLLWAFPVILLAVALGTSLALGGLHVGRFTLSGNSLLCPPLIIGVVYVPYVAKPIRGQVLGLREREFVDAARLQGLGNTAHPLPGAPARTSPRRSSSSSR